MPGVKQLKTDKDVRISSEKTRLWKFYKNLTGHRKALAEKLVDRSANQLIMIEDLETFIKLNGYVEEYTNGQNQAGKKQSSEMQAYIALSKQYNQTLKQLDDLLPAEPVKTKDDDLARFVMKKPVITR